MSLRRGGVNVFTCLRVDEFVCMCMVRGRGDILFQALNTGVFQSEKNWEGWIWGAGG